MNNNYQWNHQRHISEPYSTTGSRSSYDHNVDNSANLPEPPAGGHIGRSMARAGLTIGILPFSISAQSLGMKRKPNASSIPRRRPTVVVEAESTVDRMDRLAQVPITEPQLSLYSQAQDRVARETFSPSPMMNQLQTAWGATELRNIQPESSSFNVLSERDLDFGYRGEDNSETQAYLTIRSTPPPPPSIFVGRDSLVDQGVSHLQRTRNSTIAILGPGGMGKTSLSLAIIHHPMVERLFGPHRLFVSCEAINSPFGIITNILRLLGLGYDDQQDPAKLLMETLANARPVLLVLDNFETVWFVDGELQEVERMLSSLVGTGKVSLILTMRGEVPPSGVRWSLLLPENGLHPISLTAAQEMFLRSRTQSVQNLDNANSMALQALLREVDCVPLAINLLSHLGNVYPPTILYKRWQATKTDLLRRPGLEASRLTSVNISIETSLRSQAMLNAPEAARLLNIIAFLPEGIPHWMEMLETIAPRLRDAYHAVDILRATCLAYQDRNGNLTLLSPVRHYILHHIEISPSESSERRDYETDLQALENYCTSDLNARSPEGPKLGSANITYIFLQRLKNNFSEHLLAAAVTYSEDILTKHQSDLSFAQSLVATAELYDLSANIARTKIHLSQVMLHFGQFAEAKEAASQAYELSKTTNDHWSIANALYTLGDSYRLRNDFETASQLIGDAYREYERFDNQHGKVNCLFGLADILRLQQRYAEAAEKVQSAYEIYSSLNLLQGMADALYALGDIQFYTLDYEKAEQTFMRAKLLFIELGDKHGLADTLYSLASAQRNQGQFGQFNSYMQEAFKLYSSLGFRPKEAASAVKAIAEVALQQNDIVRAQENYELALTYYTKASDESGMADCAEGIRMCKAGGW